MPVARREISGDYDWQAWTVMSKVDDGHSQPICSLCAALRPTGKIIIMEDSHVGTVKLISKEGDTFLISTEIAKLSNLVVTTLGEEEQEHADDDNDTVEIPLSNVKSSVLSKVVEYCKHYNVEPMQQYYADFVKVDQAMLFELVTAANFMDIKPLLDLTCLAVSFFIKGKSPEEIRKIFNISDAMEEEGTSEMSADVDAEN
eukprot:scaffold3602_cov66-Cyclotella_meneghiniana.AAC.1